MRYLFFAILHWGTLFWNCSTICRLNFFANWWTTAHIYLWETLSLKGALFISNNVTNLLPGNLIDCEVSLQQFLLSPHRLLFHPFVTTSQLIFNTLLPSNSKWALFSLPKMVKCLSLKKKNVFYNLLWIKCVYKICIPFCWHFTQRPNVVDIGVVN